MKICGISDIHGELIDIPKCEVLCICGDIVGLNDQRSTDASRHWWYNRFTNWVNRQPCDKVIVTPGNHDFFIEHAYKNNYLSELKQDLSIRTSGKLVILINDDYTYKNTKFYGCPFIRPIPFQLGRWAFEDDYSGMQGDCCYSNIPADTDVLITHDNPFNNGVLDYFIPKGIKYHLYGHWHDGASEVSKNRYNCSILNDMYNRKKGFKPIVIDTMTFEEKVTIEKELLLRLIIYARLTLSQEKAEEFEAFVNTSSDLVLTSKELFDVLEEDKTPLPVTGEVFEPECVTYEEENETDED